MIPAPWTKRFVCMVVGHSTEHVLAGRHVLPSGLVWEEAFDPPLWRCRRCKERLLP